MYSCTTYGNLTGHVFANSQEDAEELICDHNNIQNQDYETSDNENINFNKDEADIVLYETDVYTPAPPTVPPTAPDY